MKKYLLGLIAMLTFAMLSTEEASAQTSKVYISTGSSAIAYHKSKDCSYLSRTKSENLKQITASEAKEMGRKACARCYASVAKARKAAAEKERDHREKGDQEKDRH